MALGVYVDLLATYLRPLWRRAALLALVLFASVGLRLANPQLLRSVIDGALEGRPAETLALLALAFIGIEVVTGSLRVVATWLGEGIAWTATNALRVDLTAHVLALDLGFHKDRTPGELIERVDGDVTALATFFSQFVIVVVGNVLLLIGVLIVLFGEDWRIGAAFSLFAAIAAATLLGLRDIAVPRLREMRQVMAELFGFLEERLAGTEDIRSSGARSFVLGRNRQLASRLLAAERWARVALVAIWSANTVVFTFGQVAAFGIGTWLFFAGLATVGTVYLVYTYASMIEQPLRDLSQQIQEIQRATAGIIRISEILGQQPLITDGPGAAMPAGALGVEFADVSFGYGGDPVLHDVSFNVAPGQVLGIAGRTGSGKSTIARLIFRLYDPAEGVVRVGGIDVRQPKLTDLRSRIAIVTQDVQLFAASIRDNLTLFRDAISDQAVIAAIEEVGLGDWLASQPDGVHTVLSSLSAGESQLLAFARAFLTDPGLVILDEASSRLDPATERRIDAAVDRLLAGRTGIIIAHRLTTIDRADRVMVLDDGRIAEEGERLALAADPSSRFARLLAASRQAVPA